MSYIRMKAARLRRDAEAHSDMMRARTFFAVCLLAGASSAAPDVVDIRATGTWAVDGVTSIIEAKASSPAGCDISGLHWCVCDASGSVVLDWNRSFSRNTKAAQLKISLRTGEYSLRATDGTWFYGNVPVRVLPRENKYAGPALEVCEPPDPSPESGAKRFWRDMWRGEFSHAEPHVKTPRRIVARFCAAYPERVGDVAEVIDRTAADMKRVGENALACPAEWKGVPDAISAWYAKFDVEGLKVFPMLEIGADAADRSARRELQRRIDNIVGVGMRHESFGGVCIRVARQDMLDAKERQRLGHVLSGRRALWVVDDADLADFMNPLRAGDAVALAVRGEFGNAAQAGVRASFVQAFRALPAVAFADVAGFGGAARVRRAEYNGTSWFYVFNPGTDTVRLKVEMPARTRDLAKDERVGGVFGSSVCELALMPGEFCAYSAPEGESPKNLLLPATKPLVAK